MNAGLCLGSKGHGFHVLRFVLKITQQLGQRRETEQLGLTRQAATAAAHGGGLRPLPSARCQLTPRSTITPEESKAAAAAAQEAEGSCVRRAELLWAAVWFIRACAFGN